MNTMSQKQQSKRRIEPSVVVSGECSTKPEIECLILKNRADGRTTYDQRMATISFETVLPRHFTVKVANRKFTTLIHESHVAEVRMKGNCKD